MCHRGNSVAAKDVIPCIKCPCILVCDIDISLCFVIPALLKVKQKCVTKLIVLQLGYHLPLYQMPLHPRL